ncbi:MAG: metallophosphoesterase [Firmicutes bacterium]|nr:metallophosphoesterase [Bacillota bacterium]
MKNKARMLKCLIIFICLVALSVVFFAWQNNGLVITKYEYTNPKLPAAFNNFTIAHVSDLHNKDFHGKLIDKIKQQNPEMIVITGDLIDRRSTNIEIAEKFIQAVVKIAPTYYVSGNHEQLSDVYNTLKRKLQVLNVNVMDNAYEVINKNGSRIGLLGVADPAVQQSEESYLWDNSTSYVEAELKDLLDDIDTSFNILLSHRPELFNLYRDLQADLVFSGHAHGGQIRMPFIGGLAAPNQGLFPKYTAGVYSSGATSMVVSRGLGNSIFPLRVFNRPELVVVTLKKS